ncbi:MAG: NAD(P)/FAD-dependent oxidoreductase [Planctomycetaceae bacterium]
MSLVPSLALDQATRRQWDVVVIGAGPAGAVAARQCAALGAATLLIERKPFPRSKVCGGCLNGRALAILEAAGLPTLARDAGAIPLAHFQARSDGRSARVGLPAGCALSRECFDAALVRAAVAAGTAFLPEVSARLLPFSGSPTWREIALEPVQAAPRSLRARVVLAADGLGHPSLRGHDEFVSRVRPTARIGLGVVLPDSPDWCEPGVIFMAVSRQGYVGSVRVENGRLNLAAAVDAEFVRRMGAARAVEAILTDAGFPPLPALQAAAIQGTPPLTRSSARCAGQRVLLLGDAAGYFEPFTGEGIAWALAAGAAAPAFVERGLNSWDNRLQSDWQRAMHQAVFGRQFLCRALSSVLRRPLLTRWLLGALGHAPALAGPFIRRLNTAPRLPHQANPQ